MVSGLVLLAFFAGTFVKSGLEGPGIVGFIIIVGAAAYLDRSWSRG